MPGQTLGTRAQRLAYSAGPAHATVDEIRFLHLEAERARAAACAANDDKISADLQQLANHYDHEARQLNLVAAAEQCRRR